MNNDWLGMPEFKESAGMHYKTLKVHYYNDDDLIDIANKLGVDIIAHKESKTTYYPKRIKKAKKSRLCISNEKHTNNFPIYIVSKGRAENCFTSAFLSRIDVEHKVIVEESEFNDYSKYVIAEKLLVLPKHFQENYDTCDNLGLSKSVGAGAARNFAWQHSINAGFDCHWVMDDNIKNFFRVHNNSKIPVGDGTFLKVCEDFFLRYENLAMAGLNYAFLFVSGERQKPFVLNTRIYSCNLIKNNIQFRWRGRYNEDTILSLDILKSGLCTVQFNSFLQGKMTTQALKGGNTKEFYEKEGTFNKSKMLADVHPDVSKLVTKYSRYHHHVDYSVFKKNKLKLKDNFFIDANINNYGMSIINVGE